MSVEGRLARRDPLLSVAGREGQRDVHGGASGEARPTAFCHREGGQGNVWRGETHCFLLQGGRVMGMSVGGRLARRDPLLSVAGREGQGNVRGGAAVSAGLTPTKKESCTTRSLWMAVTVDGSRLCVLCLPR